MIYLTNASGLQANELVERDRMRRKGIMLSST